MKRGRKEEGGREEGRRRKERGEEGGEKREEREGGEEGERGRRFITVYPYVSGVNICKCFIC